jgi:mycoredoxin
MLDRRPRIRLGRSARRLHRVNIWRDPAGAEAVRAANDGYETVPAVVVAGQPHTNPDPEWVREQLALPRDQNPRPSERHPQTQGHRD